MKRVLKWVGLVLGSLLLIVLLAGSGFAMRGRARLHHVYQVDGVLADVPADSATVARGEHMVAAHGCRNCHGQRLEGTLFIDIPLFRIVAPNLTRGKGGIGGSYQVADWDRAIRHGVRPGGTSLLVMPYPQFHQLADDDATALIAYLRQVPAVDSVIAPSKVQALGWIMVGTAKEHEIAPDLSPSPKRAPPVGATIAYGKYVASHTCTKCHGDDLRGGKHPDPDAPPVPALMAVGFWSVGQFETALRTGVGPGGKVLSDFMPWKGMAQNLTDTEIEALYAYIKSLPTQ